MKTVIVSCFHNLISRNILDTAVVPMLVQHGYRIVILVPPGKKEYMQSAFESQQVFVEEVVVPKKRWEDLLDLFSLSVASVRNHIIYDWKRDGYAWKYYTALSIHVLLSRFFWVHRFVRFVGRIYLRPAMFEQIFLRWEPDVVFATDVFDQRDRAFLSAARRAGVKRVAMVRSWDNPTSKGVLFEGADHILVQSEVIKEEMVALHKVPEHIISVVGFPHYDKVIADGPSESRENFITSTGLDPKKKTILYAPAGKILYPHDKELFSVLLKLLDEELLGKDVQFLVRLPPGDNIDTSVLEGDVRFAIDRPGIKLTSRKKDSEISKEENDRLVNSLFHADVVLVVVSTMVLDGIFCGRPTIILGFDPPNTTGDSIKRLINDPHFKKLVASGLVPVAKDERELGEQITRYLGDEKTHHEKREEIIRRYARALDGQAAVRVISAILATVEQL